MRQRNRHAGRRQRHRDVERRLPAHRRKDRVDPLSRENQFDELGRHRFDVTRQKSDALFQIHLDKSQASGGNFVINSDVDGKGQGVNLYAVRVLPEQ